MLLPGVLVYIEPHTALWDLDNVDSNASVDEDGAFGLLLGYPEDGYSHVVLRGHVYTVWCGRMGPA